MTKNSNHKKTMSEVNVSRGIKIELEENEKNLQNKKNLTRIEVYQLIKKMNLEYDKNQTKEIIQELGIEGEKTIQIDNLIETSKQRRHSSKYSNFYDNVLNLFTTPSERIIKILEESKEKLLEFKQEHLAKDLEWVIKKIHNDDIYNLNLDLLNEVSYRESRGSVNSNTDMESAMKFLAEFSSDNFSKNKKEDVKTAKSLSSKRLLNSQSHRGSLRDTGTSRYFSILTKEPMPLVNNFNMSPDILRNRNQGKSGVMGFGIGNSPNDLTSKFTLGQSSSEIINNKFEVIKEEDDKRNLETNPVVDEDKNGNNSLEMADNDNQNDSNFIKEECVSQKSELYNKLSSCHTKSEYDSSEYENFDHVYNEIDPLNPIKLPPFEGEIRNTLNAINMMKMTIRPTPPPHQMGRMSIVLMNKSVNMDNRDNKDSTPMTAINSHKQITNDSIDDIDFNIFEYSETFGRENVLINISDHIFEKYSLYCVINSKRFETFLDKVRVGYDYLLPYHNDLHATDVLQTCNVFTILTNLKSEMDITSLDLAAFFISCIIHDFKHPGLNNTYHINKKTSIATKYNDISVLENYHVSAAFKIISHPNSNIFCDLSIEEYRVARKRIVECVLATDMAKHTKSQTSLKMKLDQFKNKTSADKILYNFIQNTNEETKFDRQQEILNYLIHAADISNPGKKFEISKIWADLIMQEFFLQGDLEKKETLPISFLCDRSSTNVPRSQTMFISNIILPCFKVFSVFSPRAIVFIQNMHDNIEKWKNEEKLISEYEQHN